MYTVQVIDSNANNLMSHHSSVVAYRDQNICPRCFFSRVSSSSRNIIRPTAGASHISVWRYARDIEISLHRKFECGVYGGSTPRIVKPFPRDIESQASALGKRLHGSSMDYVKTLYLATPSVARHLSNIFLRDER